MATWHVECRWLDKDNAQASYNKRTSLPLTASPESLWLEPALGGLHCPFAVPAYCLASCYNGTHTHLYLHPTPYGYPSTHYYIPVTTRLFTVSSPLSPRVLYHHYHGLPSPIFMQAFYLAHLFESSSTLPTFRSLSHSQMAHAYRPFKEIANWLA